MVKFKFLVENKTDNPGFSAEHGLSIYIETPEINILFDTGASNLFERNAIRGHVNLKNVDACVISHGHYDHTGGVPKFCEINNKAPIYIHKNSFGECYGEENGIIDVAPCSILWSQEERKKLKSRLVLTDGVLWLTDNIVISGTIPNIPGNKPTENFYEKKADGTMIPDDMSHEEFLAIRNGQKGIILFSGCSHKGIVPAIEYAKKLFPGEKIFGIVAGMHLYSTSDIVRREVVDKVAKENPDMIMPVHCTGIDAICMLKTKFGDRCIVATAGDAYEY